MMTSDECKCANDPYVRCDHPSMGEAKARCAQVDNILMRVGGDDSPPSRSRLGTFLLQKKVYTNRGEARKFAKKWFLFDRSLWQLVQMENNRPGGGAGRQMYYYLTSLVDDDE